MSKSVLPVLIPMGPLPTSCRRTIEVPCRLPEAFNFKSGGRTFTATVYTGDGIPDACIDLVEFDGSEEPSASHFDSAAGMANAILSAAKVALGLNGASGCPVLQSFALAYAAECGVYEAHKKAWAMLPPQIRTLGLAATHPDAQCPTGPMSPAARMLAKYVEYVFEQTVKAHEVKP